MLALSPRVTIFAAALVLTVLNAVKPLTIDDAAYYYFAEHIAHDPLSPYGFEIHWYQWPHPANQVLAPPVLPYWWALAIRLFGNDPHVWKLWLFPFAWLFSASVYALARRFARQIAQPLVWLTVLSPAFLPSLNLMLDIPGLALGLGALVLFFRACARRSLMQAVLAGLVAGLAMQTKYTAILVPGVMLLYGLQFRRLFLADAAAQIALIVFVSWEVFVASRHGQSHFLANLPTNDNWLLYKLFLVKALLPILGGLTPALTLLGLVALGAGRRIITFVGGCFLLVFLIIAGTDVPFDPEVFASTGLERPLEQMLFGISGLAFGGVLGTVAFGMLFPAPPVEVAVPKQKRGRKRPQETPPPPVQAVAVSQPFTLFLLFWLLLELVGYFALSPFPAVRRVMGLVMVSTLLVGRLAAAVYQDPRARALVRPVVFFGAGLGLLFYVVDLVDAVAQAAVVERSAEYIHKHDEEASSHTWYVGHWGIQFYAERAGMQPVKPDMSLLRENDWLIVPDDRFEQQEIVLDPERVKKIARVSIRDALPLRTVRCFYGGQVPMEHLQGPRITVTIYKVTNAWTPATPSPGH